jgi:pumilio homology domain family member 6
VPKDERQKLVAELFEIITGRVKDFVFKHDSVRVIQTAVKYATPEQRKQIARELKGEYRALAESRYAKFLIAKLVMRDDEVRDMVVADFYGHVKRLIRHPEASWIMDDIYRTIASKAQKACMLREWYGPEFVIFKASDDKAPTADLSEILKENPEKRAPIMQHLKELTNQLVQKKTTGYTMLHDALLQYFLNCKPGSPEATEFLRMLQDDEGGDCYKNLAFTKAGSKLTCLTLAYGSHKDRRVILRFFKGVMKMLASDVHGHLVILTAYDVIDDTVMSAKAIFPELLDKDMDAEKRDHELLGQINHLTARIPLLYPLQEGHPGWLLSEEDRKVMLEVREIRTTTSKKNPQTRRLELVEGISGPLLDLIARHTETLVESSFGCQFITEVLFGAVGDKAAALHAIVSWAEKKSAVSHTPHSSRMLKALVQGGRFDQNTQSVKLAEPALGFADLLYVKIQDHILSWASGPDSFVIVAMLEAHDFSNRETLMKQLKQYRAQLEQVGKAVSDQERGNAGARILVQKLDEA